MKKKLILSIDEEIFARVKKYCAEKKLTCLKW